MQKILILTTQTLVQTIHKMYRSAFQRAYLVEVNVKPDIGDIFKWNEGYFEVKSYNENQLVGGQPDNSHSIVVQAHLVRMPTNNLEEYRGF